MKHLKHLIALRKSKGLGPTQLARAANVTKSTIYNIEKGIHSPKVELLERILKALDSDIIKFYKSIK